MTISDDITRCPGCARPVHATESDDHYRCAVCAAGCAFDGMVITAYRSGRCVEARVELPRAMTGGPHESRRGLAALHWLAAAITLATPDLITAVGVGCGVTVRSTCSRRSAPSAGSSGTRTRSRWSAS